MKNTDGRKRWEINTQPIFDYIKDNGLTNREFCNRCNLSVSTFNRVVNGKAIKLISLIKIADLLNLPLRNLIK